MTYKIGDVVTGCVTGIQPYGAFIALDDKVQGLIHISECQHGYVKDIKSLLKVGDKVQVQVLDIDEFTQKISLSMRTLEKHAEVSSKFRRKHYWTSRDDKIGFTPIAANLSGWITDALKNLVIK
ncbi:CvfD/Ygs/GSP13 family RNA-binding post-transcriptional regulator [Loigolactobacillus backii]|uniref:General stress protein n=1 Tax=Loigolactobacillus backii TaxID=375175 RepID=A0A192H329_9LACO|nr:CvfD/Ygs/GSP13 family RNA-binding post-transcriptional regulator [Loigolactobacillus backii]ANK59265.1 general stress protein [Loigolactobacillus backii]ANK62678.1 general stress protein [Loigolactobacillus backii]ANK64256.1 general stress protein [Loigolactobacillus backii]ANK67350.1 general stress protein [Loigolactobacillus backii]ANK70314.1 general stress protein [Loigolactobacillus backii]